MDNPHDTGQARQIVPTLVVAAFLATSCTAAALFTGMDTVFWVAGLIAVGCVVASICILEHAERERARSAREREAWFASFDRARRMRSAR